MMLLPTVHAEYSRAHKEAADRRLKDQLNEEFGANQSDVYVLSAEETTRLWIAEKKNRGSSDEELQEKFEKITGLVLDHTGTALSSAVLVKLGAEMHRSGNIFGGYRVIHREGNPFIVFGGKASLRRHLNSRVFAANDPRVIKLGVGRLAANAALKSGMVLSFFLSPVIRGVEWFFTDHHSTIESVLGHISTDLVKASVSALVGYIATVGVAAFMGASIVAVAPVAAGIVIAIAVGTALNILDNSFGITQRMSESLIAIRGEWSAAAQRNRVEWQRAKRDLFYYMFSTEGQLEFIRRFTGTNYW